jgi:hypothetical protein
MCIRALRAPERLDEFYQFSIFKNSTPYFVADEFELSSSNNMRRETTRALYMHFLRARGL